MQTKKITHIFTDCDGCLTDGSVFVFENGVEARRYNTADGQAVQIAKQNGVEVVFITTEKNLCHRYRAEKLGCAYIRSDDKKADIENIYGKDIIYAALGDTLSDESMLQGALHGFSFVPNGSDLAFTTFATFKRSGGNGLLALVVRSVLEYNRNVDIKQDNERQH